MTREDILRMAREAELNCHMHLTEHGLVIEDLEHFAALVAVAQRDRIIAENAPEIERINAYIKALEDAARQALEALDGVLDTYGEPLDKLSIAGGTYEALYCRDAITALRAALAEPEQEPVAKVELMTAGGNAGLATRIVEIDDHLRERLRPGQLLYTAPPQRKPLTDEEIRQAADQRGIVIVGEAMIAFARAIERAHKIF